MQSDSSPTENVNNDATATTKDNQWAKDLESLETFFCDENRFNQAGHSKSNDATRSCLSPTNPLNNSTNKSSPDNLNNNNNINNDKSDKLNCSKSTEMNDETNDDKDMLVDQEMDEEMNEEMNEEVDERYREISDEDDYNEEESDEELDKRKVSKRKKKVQPMKRRKRANERRNIKDVKSVKDLDEKIQLARKEEKERINRILELQKQLKSEKQAFESTTTNRIAEDIVCVLSSDEEDVQVIESSDEEKKHKIEKTKVEEKKIEIGGEEEEEEDIVISYERIQDELDGANSGLHTDDSLNTLNKDGRCLVNIGHPSADPDIFLDDYLAKKVKPHQIGGIRFMYDCIIENLTKVKSYEGIGCVLSHSMGLGKTLQVIAFSEIFLRVTPHRTILCIVPVNTIQNWISEFDNWLPNKQTIENSANLPSTSKQSDPKPPIKDDHLALRKPRTFKVYSLAELKTFTQRSIEIRQWRKNGGVLLMGYEVYRMLFSDDNRKTKKKENTEGMSVGEYQKLLKEIQESLINPGPDLVVCDEGHRIKNCKASISKALKEIRTRRRIILTGYPLQNNLVEYWCMVDFVRPDYLGSKNEFINMFERPIANGQCVDSIDGDRKLSRKRAHVLHKLLIGFVQRRSFQILFHTLPPKHEYCLYIRMTKLQRNLLLAFFRNLQSIHSARPFCNNPLYIYSVCYKIWNHSDVLYRKMKEKNESDDEDEELEKQAKDDLELNYDWANVHFEDYKTGVLENSMKMIILFKIIDETIKLGERLLIFSQSLATLDVIEGFLCQRVVPNDKRKRKFERSVNYLRLDGSTASIDRKHMIDRFNKNASLHLFLISTRAGSLGINLTGANRLVLLDISFNPCHDAQAVHRIYRYGQKRECFVYRFIFDNSLEKRIFDRQINKQSMSNQVVDEINTDTHLTLNEINSMVDGLACIEDPDVPRFSNNELNSFSDPVMKIICRDYNHCLTRKPMPHESLLAESEATKLTRSEKQIAEWEYNQTVLVRQRNYARMRRINSLQNQETTPAISDQSQMSFNGQQAFQNNTQQPPLNNMSNGQQMNQTMMPSTSNYFESCNNPTNPSTSVGQLNESRSLIPSYAIDPSTNKPYNESNQFYNRPSYQPNQLNYGVPFNSNPMYNQQQQTTTGSRSNANIRNFVIPTNLKIKDEMGSEIFLKKNQTVQLIQNQNSLVLRTYSGAQIRIKGACANYFLNAANQPNLNNVRPHTAPSSNSVAPEVIYLNDEE